MSREWRDAILENTNGVSMEMPMIVLHGSDATSLLSAANRLVLSQDRTRSEEDGWGPKESEDVHLPVYKWGAGRRVVVDRRYHLRTGAILVRVPDATISNTNMKEDDHGCHPGAAHVARCAGVFEVIKEFANSWAVDMKRRIAILHLACRLPAQYQGALRKLAEDSHASTLFVLTSTRPFSLDHGIHSRAVFVPIPAVGMGTPAFDPLGTALRLLQNAGQSQAAILNACAEIDHSVARIISFGGDIVAARAIGGKCLTRTFSLGPYGPQ